MSVINTNVSALVAQNAIVKNDRATAGAMEQLSTGKRINSAADDAAGLAISSRMSAQIDGLNQAVRNGNDAVSLIQTADGSLTQVTDMLQRMRTLAVQAASDTNTADDRTALNQEFTLLRTEINRIGNNTQWNGENVLDQSFADNTGAYSFQVGANNAQTIDLTIGNYTTTDVATQGTKAAVATTTNASGPSASIAAKQVSTLTITTTSGTAAEGDVIAITVGDVSYVHTVTAAQATGVENADKQAIAVAIEAGLKANGLGTTAKPLSSTAVISTSATGGVITFTAASDVFGSNSFSISKGQGGLLSGINSSDILTASNANSSISALDTAINTVNTGRAAMGATINVLVYAVENLSNVSLNASASKSRIEDTDFATATTELAKTQIIGQAATAMLAQANQLPQNVLSLLK
jgi:flagellin